MTNHLVMDGPDERRVLDRMQQGLVGTPMARPDGPDKVSGRATYAHEHDVEGCAHGVFARATITRGTVVDLRVDDVLAMDGVLAVVDDDRLLRNPAQGTADQAPVQGPGTVSYHGQPIALVVAETFEQARHAAQSLRPAFDADDDVCVDPHDPATPTEQPESDQLAQGDLDAAMADAAHAIDVVYTTPGHSSAPMEPHCSIARWDGDRLTLWGSYQMLRFNINELSDALGVEPDDVRILAPFVGGGFGSKLGIGHDAVAAAIAAKQLGRPVCVTLSRQQVFEATMRRSETIQRIRLAADADGRLTGLGHQVHVSQLPDETFYEPVLQATHFAYAGEHRTLGLTLARVQRTCAGSVRAPGEAVGIQALEGALDELAHASGIDPVELRRRNIPERHPEEDLPYSARALDDALRVGAERFGWADRDPTPAARREGEWLLGTGMAGATRVNQMQPAEARVTLHADGTATVETDMTDIGTGTYAILTQVAGELLGLPGERVTTRLGDSDLPTGPGSGGSWGASSSASAVFLACMDLREQLAGRVGCDEDELVLVDGTVAVASGDARDLDGVLDGDTLAGEGSIEPGDAADDVLQATYGAVFAEVAVSAVTGEVRVRRLGGVFDVGRVLNERTATSQVHGGIVWGLGIALTEELAFDPRNGRIVNRDLAEYHVPVNLDVPEIDVLLLDERDDWASPVQSKGIGELGICGSGAAVLNAVHHATGIRVRDFPCTPDKLLADLPPM